MLIMSSKLINESHSPLKPNEQGIIKEKKGMLGVEHAKAVHEKIT